MAHKVSELPPRGGGAPPKYRWQDWLDGDAWELIEGRDYDCTPAAFVRAAQDYGKRHGLVVESRQQQGRVFLQARLAG